MNSLTNSFHKTSSAAAVLNQRLATIHTTLQKMGSSLQGVLRSFQQMTQTMKNVKWQGVFNSAKTAIDNIKNSIASVITDLANISSQAPSGATTTATVTSNAGPNDPVNPWPSIMKAVESAKAQVTKLTTASDNYMENKAKLGAVNDGLQTQAELQDRVYVAAQRSQSAYGDMLGLVTKLSSAGGNIFGSNKEAIAFAELTQKSMAVSGANTAESQAGGNLIAGIMGKGGMKDGDFSQVMEKAPVMAQAIANFTGKSTDELRKMSAEGLITADVIKGAMFSSASDIESRFAETPNTFGGIMTLLRNSMQEQFQGIYEAANQFLNSEAVMGIVSGILVAMSIVGGAINWLIQMISIAGQFIADHWNVIGTILGVLLVSALLYVIYLTVAWGISAMQSGMQAMLGMLQAIWPILLIAAAIGAVIGILSLMGVSFDQVLGYIGGALYGLYAFMFNIVATLWNYWSSFAEFFQNVFNHPVYSIKKLFANLANSILDMVGTIAEALDTVFGSNMANGIISVQSKLDTWVGEEPEGYKSVTKLELKDIGKFVQEGFKDGSNLPQKVKDISSEIASQFKGGATDDLVKDQTSGYQVPPANQASSAAKTLSQPSGATVPSVLGTSGGTAIPTVGKVGEVEKINQEVNIADEDLQLLKDVAEMRYTQNFVTMTPQLTMNATISEKVDVNEVLNQVEMKFVNEIAANAEGTFM